MICKPYVLVAIDVLALHDVLVLSASRGVAFIEREQLFFFNTNFRDLRFTA